MGSSVDKSGPPMTRAEFDGILSELHLNQADLARMMNVEPRTVRRWAAKPAAMNPAAKTAMRSWVRLHRNGHDWGDGSVVGGRNLCAAIGLTWQPPSQQRVRPMPDDFVPEHFIVEAQSGSDGLGVDLAQIWNQPDVIAKHLRALRFSLWTAAETRRIASEIHQRNVASQE